MVNMNKWKEPRFFDLPTEKPAAGKKDPSSHLSALWDAVNEIIKVTKPAGEKKEGQDTGCSQATWEPEDNPWQQEDQAEDDFWSDDHVADLTCVWQQQEDKPGEELANREDRNEQDEEQDLLQNKEQNEIQAWEQNNEEVYEQVWGVTGEQDEKSLSDQEQFLTGFHLYDLALGGDQGALASALALWEALYREHPYDNLARAYYGACLILQASNSDNQDKLLSHSLDGLQLVNSALEKEPGNLRLRYLRAYLYYYKVPENVGPSNEQAIEDFIFLQQTYERDNQAFDTELYHQVMFDLGFAYQQAGKPDQAKKIWAKLHSESPKPRFSKALEKLLT
ncbi:hypothetical protein JCM39194_03860 [Desulfotomaculum varum]